MWSCREVHFKVLPCLEGNFCVPTWESDNVKKIIVYHIQTNACVVFKKRFYKTHFAYMKVVPKLLLQLPTSSSMNESAHKHQGCATYA